MSIAYYHNGVRVYNEDILSEDFEPQPKNPETLATDSLLGKSIRNAFYWNNYVHDVDILNVAYKDIGYTYYGSYNGCVAVIMEVNGGTMSEEEKVEEVGGVTFFYSPLPYAGTIQIWKAN